MKDYETHDRKERILARLLRALLLLVGFFLIPLLGILLIAGGGGKAHATGFNSWPHSKGIAHCWTRLFEQYGANMAKVTQTVSADSALVNYHVTLQGGKEMELVCHPASGKVMEAEQERSNRQE
jgi:cytochrome b561